MSGAQDDQLTQKEANPFGRFRWKDWRVMLPVFLLIASLIFLGIHYHINYKVIAGSTVVIGLLSGAFAWVVGVIGLVPIIGPILVKVLSLSVIWLLNALGYLISYIAIRRGYSQDVLTYRGLTIALIIGIVIGYILGSTL
ncbi:MAG: hypothetical protein B7Y48_01620 [Methylophilales bacterium 28-44-11]|jgi:hypothetical protein|nr:MAG: hypothetical protein B7Y48_01620 [Methylophilales bacterium 28-44-11]